MKSPSVACFDRLWVVRQSKVAVDAATEIRRHLHYLQQLCSGDVFSRAGIEPHGPS